MATKRQVRSWQRHLQRSMDKIAAERDALRETQDEIEGLIDSSTRGCEALQEAIDALSELL